MFLSLHDNAFSADRSGQEFGDESSVQVVAASGGLDCVCVNKSLYATQRG